MGYKLIDWKKRIRNRSDLSNHLTHLTRKNHGLSSMEVLLKILNEKEIKASKNEGFIIGDNSAVCFQDVPVYGICQNTYHEELYRKELGGKVRYKPIGISFDKRYVYLKGGRPVLYEKKEIAKRFIEQDEWWRIVSYDLSDSDNIIDWTHEREWRYKGNFKFELSEVTVLLLNNRNYKKFMQEASDEIINNIGGIVVLNSILT